MAVHVLVSQVVDRPVADVFQFYARDHVRNHPRWDPEMELKLVGEGPIGVGTIIRRRNLHSGTPVEGWMEVTEFEVNESMGVEIHEGPSETRGLVTFQPEGPDRTRLTIQADFANLDESLSGRITGLVQRSADNIKCLIESEM